MNETIIFPSPNWFQASVFAASSDNWLVYGGPSKSLCVLEPLPLDSEGIVRGNQGYQAHVLNRAHPEKIVCVDISPEWPAKRYILTGSVDGTVKQWSLEKVKETLKIKATQNHEIHYHEKEEVAGVGYCNNGYAVTVGCHGHIVKWDLNSNVMKTFNQILKNFKPVCMACSPHIHLNVAIGTKQGVVFVLDLNGIGRVLCKVRGQDDEITKVGWCPQYEVMIRKNLKESEAKRSVATERMEKIRQEPESPEVLKELDERVEKSASVEHFMKTGPVQIAEESTSLDHPVDKIDSPEQLGSENDTTKDKDVSLEQPKRENCVNQPDIVTNDVAEPKPSEELDESGIGKTLPEDSFDQTVVSEDDMFDIYVDHEADEFGHKKFQPIDIVVTVTEEKKENDFLSECLKLKEDILKRKNDPETSIGALVEALDKTHVDSGSNEPETNSSQNKGTCDLETMNTAEQSSVHVQKHLLATISKHGSVRIWSKSGKLVASCAVFGGASGGGKNQRNQRNQRNSTNWTTLLWYKPDVLLIADGKSQLLECNALKLDCKAKLEWTPIVQQRRSIYTIASNAPRVQTPDMLSDMSHDHLWYVWTTSQDRTLVKYSIRERQALSVHNTSGGFLYTVQSCPYDARKVAVSVGDGGVRVWEAGTLDEDETKLTLGYVATYWNNVQGKVLTVAWHPTRENLLAFGTAESRVGLIDASGSGEKPARVLQPALNGGVYCVCWGDGCELYACAGGEMVVYRADKPEDAPTPMRVELEGQKWELSTARWYTHALVCGSNAGAVAVLSPNLPHDVIAATFVFSRMIHTIDWHPQQTSSSNEESPYKNLIAVCSLDKCYNIVILEYGDKEDGTKQLSTWKTLSGHKQTVLQVAWSPHVETQLLSTSQDGTVRIWDAAEGVCTSIFAGHVGATLGAAWSAFPQLAGAVLSGGGDCCLRLWDAARHPADKYLEEKQDAAPKRERRKKEKKEKKNADDGLQNAEEEGEASAAIFETKIKCSKKFLLPMIYRQINPCSLNGLRKLLKKHLQGSGDGLGTETVADATENYDLDYLKLFGSINEVNELLDDEMERHQDTGNLESWMMLSIFRGHIDAMIQFASQRDLLDSFLVSITPCVSFKYWKDVMQMYLAQIDRLVARGEEANLCHNKHYGGPVYRKAAALLSIHDVKGAVNTLIDARLFKEAYVLCRTRYIESIAEETLQKWAHDSGAHGCWNLSAACHIALGNLSQAATVLAKSPEEDSLCLAAEIAKVVGQAMFVDHIEKKRELLKTSKDPSQNDLEELEELPSRVEQLLLKNTQENLASSAEKLPEITLEESNVDKTENENSSLELPSNLDVGENNVHGEKEEKKETKEELEELSSQMEQLLKDDNQNTEAVLAKVNGGHVNGNQNEETHTNGEQNVSETKIEDQHNEVKE